MSIRLLGAFLILSGCGWFGFSMASAHRARENGLRQLIRAAEFMECELQFRQTPLPQLCHLTSNILNGELGRLFSELGERLDRRSYADVSACMDSVQYDHPNLPEGIGPILSELGQHLGQFDLAGQLSSLRSVQAECESALKQLMDNKENRLRSYQTLGLCTGAALAVLLL